MTNHFHHTQRGFTAIESLLVTIIVLMVAFTGYYVYHTQSQTNKTLNAASSVAQNSPGKGSVKSNKPAAPSTTEVKAPADSQTPAASSCSAQSGATVTTVTVTLDQAVPSPRCVSVIAIQTLTLYNPGTTSTTATLGSKSVTIPADQSVTINDQFGNYLQLGVHIVHTPIYGGGSGPEIWLK